MSHTRRRTRWLVTAAALVSLAACTNDNPNAGLPTGAQPGLYPQISVSTTRSTARADLALLQVPGGLSLGSYQGEVTFDPQVLTFQDAELPQGVEGVANLVSPGHIRFAGTALDGVTGAPVLSMTFAVRSEVRREAFSVSFEEVTDAAEFADVTAQVKNGTLIFQSR